MPRIPTFFDYWHNAVQLGMMVSEAQTVIAMRVMGMAGLWSVSPSENSRMVSEKMYAFTKSMTAAGFAAVKGGTPDRITRAAIAPIRRKTRANTRRLGSRGLKRT